MSCVERGNVFTMKGDCDAAFISFIDREFKVKARFKAKTPIRRGERKVKLHFCSRSSLKARFKTVTAVSDQSDACFRCLLHIIT